MTEIINETTLAEYEAFVQGHPKGNFAQSSMWAKQKSAWTWRAIACRGADGRIKGTVSFLIRKMPGFGRAMMYASRGPVCDIDDYATMDELFARAKELAKEFKAYVIKIDPDIPSSETAFTDYMTRYGFVIKSGGEKFEAIQPRYVFRLYLSGRTEDELLASFHQKTRYNIRLAIKKGVKVEICGKEMVPEFGRLMLQTGVRDGFVTRQPEYFAQMLDNLGEHARLYMAFIDEPQGDGRTKRQRGPQLYAQLPAAVGDDPLGGGEGLPRLRLPRRTRRRGRGSPALRPGQVQARLQRGLHRVRRRNGPGAQQILVQHDRKEHPRLPGGPQGRVSAQKQRKVR